MQLFIGQVMGTAVGSKVFTEHGWRPDASLNLAWTGFTLFVLFLRGPHCPRYTWIGWQGGFELRKSRVVARQQADREAAAAAEKQRAVDEDENGDGAGREVAEEARDEKIRVRSEVGEEKADRDERKGQDMV